MNFPTRLYTLKCPITNNHFGFIRNNKSYMLGFPEFDVAKKFRRYTNCPVNVKLEKYARDETSVYLSRLVVPKKININNGPFFIEEMDTGEYMDLPMQKNIGVAFVIDTLEVTILNYEFTTLIIDPLYDTNKYREALI